MVVKPFDQIVISAPTTHRSKFNFLSFVILCGDDEVSKNAVTIKNLNVGKQMSANIKDRSEWKQSTEAQKTVAFDQLLNEIK